MNPQRLGASLFSVGDLYPRMKAFRSMLGKQATPLYFAKVDVQSAFDTIPQLAILRLISALPKESRYRLSKHLELTLPGGADPDGVGASCNPSRKYITIASAASSSKSFQKGLIEEHIQGKRHTIFVDNVVDHSRDTSELLDMLYEHIQHNMVKIGKKYYRQKQGIPQGSVLSSLLCNYFYADLEAKHLSFLQKSNSLIVRLIDDFLLITTDRTQAKRFLQVMHDGVPEYGVCINEAKSLTNFEVAINGHNITRVVGDVQFPYCGNLINTKTLNITKDRDRRKDMGQCSITQRCAIADPVEAISDSLTVEFSKTPGRTFQRKTLSK